MDYLFQSPWDISGIFAIALYAAIVHYMKKHHEEQWRQLGGPGAVYSDLDVASRGLWGFLFAFKFFWVRDVKLWILCLSWYVAIAGCIVAVTRHILGLG